MTHCLSHGLSSPIDLYLEKKYFGGEKSLNSIWCLLHNLDSAIIHEDPSEDARSWLEGTPGPLRRELQQSQGFQITTD